MHLSRSVACLPVVPFVVVMVSAAVPARQQDQQPAERPVIDPSLYSALKWRNIGPFRGGRCVAVAGVAAEPHTYYFGACGGGVWKTGNAGHTWTNISDKHFKTGSIGAIAVAPSDPNVIYVGTGEGPVRAVTTTHGDGVYKSTDRGKTWKNVGLRGARHIPAIRVHPKDPDIVWVAAQGSPWGSGETRGVYRSADGGATWKKVLFVNEDTGAADLSVDQSNPRILYASMWDHRRKPWQVRSGGSGSGLHKSVDGGLTWQRLSKGLPKGMGKMGVAVSPADPERVYAIIESDAGGLYRSDDAGSSWKLINTKRVLRARSWYYMHIFADPVDAETVYVLNAPMMKSVDGGKTFTAVKTPHGDNHDLWINPRDPRLMVQGNDGGANVSLDGGKTWSTQNNQPTAQFYRVNTDNRFPFWVYGGQQDNSTVAIRSRTFERGIGNGDWHSVGGGESAHISFDANDPQLVYATSILGVITEFDRATGHARGIQAYPQFVLGADAKDCKYRFNWNPPVVVSRHDSKVIYHGGNVLLKSTDRGTSWEPISRDLTRNEASKQGKGGVPYTNEAASAEIYNTIFYIAESPHDAGVIWIGTDDGLVHVTRDGGRKWNNVTPSELAETQINAIEVSPHDKAKVYIAVTGYKFDDFRPEIYRTDDFGANWRKLVKGLPEDTFVRVVREDPVRKGLLYAGTEAGMFVSFDDGENWQTLQNGLPPVPVTDLMLRQGSLVAATQGRAFWILDDLGPLRELNVEIAKAEHHLFAPGDGYRLIRRGNYTRKPGTNPPDGVRFWFYLREVPDPKEKRVALEIVDAADRVVRTFANQKTDLADAYLAARESHKTGGEPYGFMELKKGMNELVWNLRRENVSLIAGHLLPSGWAGPRVVPGPYRVRLRVGDDVVTESFRIHDDPRRKLSPKDFEEYDTLVRSVYNSTNELHDAIVRMRIVRKQITAMIASTSKHEAAATLAAACNQQIEKILAWEERVIQSRRETQQDVANFANRLSMQLMSLLSSIDSGDPPISSGAAKRFADLSDEWRKARSDMRSILRDIGVLNQLLRDEGVHAVHVPRY